MAEELNFEEGDEVLFTNPFYIGETIHRGILTAVLDDKCKVHWSDGTQCWAFYEDLTITFKHTEMAQNPTKVAAVLQAANTLLQANNTVTTLEIKKYLLNDSGTNWMYWDQQIVHDIMDSFYTQGVFKIVQDNGTYRTYSAVKTPASLQKRGRGRPRKAVAVVPTPQLTVAMSPQPKRGRGRPRKTTLGTTPTPTPTRGYKYINRKKALELMQNNKGHFFTAVFEKKDGTDRTMNCQYLKDQATDPLGYVKVKEAIRAKQAANSGGKDNPIRNVNLQTLKALKIAGASYRIR